jgi:glycogen operon protein
VTDVTWFSPTGKDMTDADWGGFVRCLGIRLAGDLIGEVDEDGELIVGDTLLMLMNADHNMITFTLPPTNPYHRWERLFDTADDNAPPTIFDPRAAYDLQARSSALFRTYLDVPDKPSVSSLQADAMRKEIKHE